MFSHSQVHLSTFGLGDRDGVGDPVTEGVGEIEQDEDGEGDKL